MRRKVQGNEPRQKYRVPAVQFSGCHLIILAIAFAKPVFRPDRLCGDVSASPAA